MPIVKNEKSVYVEYTMPEHVKELITDEFLKEFRNQLFRMHENYSLDSFADEGIPMNTSTNGWYTAFGKACLLTHKEKLLDYWRSLPWYDSDIFDGELADMLVERKFILNDADTVIGKLLNINHNELVRCSDCGRLYTKDMTHIIKDDENDDEEWIQYICFYCHDARTSEDINLHSTDYYREVLKELKKYSKEHPITNDLD